MLELGGGLIYRVLGDSYRWWVRRRRQLSESDRINLRAKWKKEVEAELFRRHTQGLRCDVILRDVQRVDEYPDTKSNKGISPWFKVGLMGTYHRGILAGLEWKGVRPIDGEAWVFDHHSNSNEPALTAILNGYIRYENIEHIDWDGDEFGGHPHVYCHFDEKGCIPYERLAYCERKELDGYPYFVELASFESVIKNSKKRNINRYPSG